MPLVLLKETDTLVGLVSQVGVTQDLAAVADGLKGTEEGLQRILGHQDDVYAGPIPLARIPHQAKSRAGGEQDVFVGIGLPQVLHTRS